MPAVFGFILLPNIIKMWWLIILKPEIKVPFMKYLTGFADLIVHMFTQKRALGCDDNQLRWFEHFIIVIGYLGLLFTTVFLDWFSNESLFVIVLGYAMSIIIFIVTIDFMSDRIKKQKEMSKFSQPSDWMFVVWLFLMGLTAFHCSPFHRYRSDRKKYMVIPLPSDNSCSMGIDNCPFWQMDTFSVPFICNVF